MPFSWARAAARCGPSVRARELCLRSRPVALMAGTLATACGRAGSGRGVGRAGRAGRAGGGAAGALEALALPAPEAPDVPVDRLRVDLPAREVHVGLRDQAPLVT